MNEVINYIDEQYKSGLLSPSFYNDVLLFISEILPFVENQDVWIDFGYRLCRDIKQNLEKYGFHNTAMFGGLGYQCFAVKAFCSQVDFLKGFSKTINKLLFIAIDDKLKKVVSAQTFDYNYDLISGISGNLYYLLDCDFNQDEKQIITKCIEYLLTFTKDTKYGGQAVIKFHILNTSQNPNLDQENFKNGNINFGLAHGMLAPLIALAKAYARGFDVEGLKEGIEKTFHLYETFQSMNDEQIPYWPASITVDEYTNKICKPKHLHRTSSWCYGNIGVIRGLQKVSGYMKWNEKEEAFIKMMKQIYAQRIQNFKLFSPSLCHGFSSLLAIQVCAYAVYGDPALLTHIERNVRQVIATYRKSNERKLSLQDLRSEANRIEGNLQDLSFLTGSVGVAITLMSLNRNINSSKLLMID